MRTHLLCLLAGLALFEASAQEPITPLWAHVDPYGAGSHYPYFDVFFTQVTFDQGAGHVRRAIQQSGSTGTVRIQEFDADGNDLTPDPPTSFIGPYNFSDFLYTTGTQLTAFNDTLALIMRYGDQSWLKSIGPSGDARFLLGFGSGPAKAYHKDSLGILILVGDQLYSYDPALWPQVTVAAPNATRMAVLGNSVVLGAPPSLSHIDRGSLVANAPIVVPSNGTALEGACLVNGSSAFNYAAINSNGILDVGLVDLASGLVWSTTLTLEASAVPTAYHVDTYGNFWVAVAPNGRLYRFSNVSGQVTETSYGRVIDDITTNGSTLYLTGRVVGSNSDTFLAAFDTEVITAYPSTAPNDLRFYPDPASDHLYVQGLDPNTTSVALMDVAGQLVRTLTGPFTDLITVPVSDLRPGVYFLRSAGMRQVITKRFQVVR